MAFPENIVNDTGIKHIWDKVTAALSGKVDKVSGKGLSTNDYTTAEKDKLAGIESGAQVNAITSVAGKTGAVTLDKADVGLGNVDNTSDANKPISTATQNALNNKADNSDIAGTKTTTGNPITLTDASETYAQGLSVKLEPKQDLHGQSAPYVGGAGKNKLPLDIATIKSLNTSGTWSGNAYTVSGATFTVITDDGGNVTEITKSGTPNADINFHINGGNEGTNVEISAILSGCPSGGSESTYYLKATYYNIIDTGNGATMASFWTRRTNADIVVKSGFSRNLSFKPMIRLSTETDPTFAPWENICPISGYEGVEVEDVGFNQWDEEWEVGGINSQTGENTINNARIRSKNYTSVIPGSKIYVKNGGSGTVYVFFYDQNKNYLNLYPAINNKEYTLPGGVYYVRFSPTAEYGTTYNHDISINYPSTDTDYHPYQSRTASVTFGQTVYGGMSDFTEGGTDVTVDEIDLGTLEWTKYAAGTQEAYTIFAATSLTDKNVNVMCSCYKAVEKARNALLDGEIGTWNSSNAFYPVVRDSTKDNMTATEFKAAMSGVQLVYEKATPTTLATPKTDLNLLQDTNNITTNGTTITLDYIPNNSIGDAVKASEEYTDRAVERVIPKAKLACFYEIFDESGTLYDVNIPEDCNFFLVEYHIQNRIGSTLIKARSIDFYIPVVVNVGGEQHWVEFLYNSIYHTIDYTSNVTTGFGVLSIYTI